MEDYLESDFIETLVNYRGVSYSEAVELWKEHKENYMEDIFEHMSYLLTKIELKEGL